MLSKFPETLNTGIHNNNNNNKTEHFILVYTKIFDDSLLLLIFFMHFHFTTYVIKVSHTFLSRYLY